MKKLTFIIVVLVLSTFGFRIALAKDAAIDTKVLVLIDSHNGGTLALAKLIAKAVETQIHTTAIIKRVPNIAGKNNITADVASLPIATVEELPTYDAIAWGSPVYFSNVSSNMKFFLDGTVDLWNKRALDGMPTSVFMSAGSGAGKESALTAFIQSLAAHGMTIITNGTMGAEHLDKEIPQGNSPLGITSLTALPGEHPTRSERIIATQQGIKLAKFASAIKKIRNTTYPEKVTEQQKTSAIEARLHQLGIVLPSLPAPVGNYKLFNISNKLIYINQIALRNNTVVHPGTIGKDITEEQAKLATEQTILNVLAILKEAAGGNLDNVKQAVQLTGFFNTVPEYSQHASLLNVASDLLVKVFGEQGKHTRAAIGSSSLPLNSAVEIQAIFELKE